MLFAFIMRKALWDCFLVFLEDEMELLENDEEELVLEPAEWELDTGGQICVCGTPSTADLISCSGSSCPIGWFHKKCVALVLDERGEHEAAVTRDDEWDGAPSTSQGEPAAAAAADWLCEFCVRVFDDDAGDAAADSVITSSSTSTTTCSTNTGVFVAPWFYHGATNGFVLLDYNL